MCAGEFATSTNPARCDEHQVCIPMLRGDPLCEGSLQIDPKWAPPNSHRVQRPASGTRIHGHGERPALYSNRSWGKGLEVFEEAMIAQITTHRQYSCGSRWLGSGCTVSAMRLRLGGG